MKKPLSIPGSFGLSWIIPGAGGLILLIGMIALLGWIAGLEVLSSFSPKYMPMAPATAIMASIFGLVFLSGSFNTLNKIVRNLSIVALILVSLYGLMKFMGFLVNLDLTGDSIFFPTSNYLGRFPINRSSPLTGFLFFLSGVGALIQMTFKNNLRANNLISIFGMLVLLSGFACVFGYLYNAPFFYDGNIIPIALPSSIVFFLLGLVLVSLAGSESYLLRPLSGNSPSAVILRAIIPVIIISILGDDFFDLIFVKLSPANHILFSTAAAVFLIPLTIWVVVKVSQRVFQQAEKAESARLQAEAFLKESEQRYRLLIENQGEGVGLVNSEECFVFANPAAETIFGVPKGGLDGRDLRDFLSPEALSRVLEETEKRSQFESSSYEIEILSADKQLKYLLVTATPQISNTGAFLGTFGVFRDITERKKAEAVLNVYTNELKESNVTKDNFFTIIAHDLKNPFNAILGLTDILISDVNSLENKEIEATLKIIKNSSESAFELLEDLLLWANAQTGVIKYKPEQINLHNIVYEIETLLEAQAKRKNIRLSNLVSDDDIAFGDNYMIQTVVRNLLSNAIKFTHTGGQVKITAERQDTHLKIIIKDSGIGIEQKNLLLLFNIDKKYSSLGTNAERGTGLGLILCKDFVEKNGGEIGVSSEPGLGSTFFFTIPCNK
ncbi:MAG: ATP-binding protein [Bacteroidota bacterium]